MEYTNEFLARVYGAYWGCETTYLDEEGDKCNVNLQTIDYMLHEKEVSGQLSLIPLSEISDEDAIEVANVCGYKKALKSVKIEIGQRLNRTKNGAFVENFILTQRVIDFLRSKGYDTGFAEIPSLIDAGIAIKKQQP